MASPTATIRVPKETRDKLAAQARERGVSLAAHLSEMARRQEVEAIFESERQARREDAENPEALGEMRLWEEAPLETPLEHDTD